MLMATVLHIAVIVTGVAAGYIYIRWLRDPWPTKVWYTRDEWEHEFVGFCKIRSTCDGIVIANFDVSDPADTDVRMVLDVVSLSRDPTLPVNNSRSPYSHILERRIAIAEGIIYRLDPFTNQVIYADRLTWLNRWYVRRRLRGLELPN